MTISMVLPFPNQGVVAVLRRRWLVLSQSLQGFFEVAFQRGQMLALRLVLIVALENAGTLNLSVFT